MLTEAVLLLVTLPLLAIYIFKWYRVARGFPPGPPRYPLVGSLPSLRGDASKSQYVLTDMAKEYGDLFTLYLPFRPTIVINSYKLAHEALVKKKDDFSGRPYFFVYHVFNREGKGFAFKDFSKNIVQKRKIVHSAMRLYQPYLEGKILEEAEELAKRFLKQNCNPFDPKMDFTLAVVNVIYSIIYGTRHFEIDEPEFVNHVEYTEDTLSLSGPMNILNLFPWLINFPIPSTNLLKETLKKRTEVRDKRYFKIKATFQENKIRHLLDALLLSKLDEERCYGLALDTIDDDNVMGTLDSIYEAGTETTATILQWLIAYLLNIPSIQEKLYAEIKQVYGYDGRINLQKRKSCHYLEATITEVLRCCSIVPIFPHKTTCDTTLSGYHIPKDTAVFLNMWAINHDIREWENPEEFNPNRFLDSEGHFTGTLKMSYIPFGAGRRVCIGESLAKTELFLIFATLVQKFQFENPPGCPPPNIKDSILGLSLAPKPYKVIARAR